MDNKKTIAYKKILVINLGGIGDMLLSLPAMKALRAGFPESQISILVVPRVLGSLKELLPVDNVYVFYKNYSLLGFLKSIVTILMLRGKHFDLAINMRTLVSKKSAEKIKALLYIINPKVKVGRNTANRGEFFDLKIPEADPGDRYEMEYCIDIVGALGIKVFDRNIDLKVEEQPNAAIKKLLVKELVRDDDILIGIHPGGSSSRRWPIKNFSSLINDLAKRMGCVFIITGNKDEHSLAAGIKKAAHAKVIDCSGKLNFKELTALIKRCNLFISNDTGPMHIAAILGVPLIAIFGPGYLKNFDPRNISNRALVLQKPADCAPCNKLYCNSMACLTTILPEEVVKAALDLLK